MTTILPTAATWATKLEMLVTGASGTCPSVAPWPAVLDAIGPAGGGSYQWTMPSIGIIVTITYVAGDWKYLIQQSGPQDWFLASGTLDYLSVLGYYEKSITRTRVSPSFCTQDLTIRWTPLLLQGDQPGHSACQEKDPTTSSVWNWEISAVAMPGMPYREVHRGGNQWLTQKVRGMVRGPGGWGALPRYPSSWVLWRPDLP